MNFFKFDTSPLQKKFKNAIREKKTRNQIFDVVIFLVHSHNFKRLKEKNQMIIHAWCYIFTVCELFYCKNALVYLLENVFTDYK